MDRQASIDLLLDHYENPRHYGRLDEPTFTAEGVNPGCGDIVQFSVQLDDEERIIALTFEGEGCTISQAAASLLTEMALGHTLDHMLALEEDALADLIGHEIVVNRLPCASLALRVLQAGGQAYRNEV